MWRFSIRFNPNVFEPAQPMPGAVLTLSRKGTNGNVTITAQRAARNSSAQTLDEQVKGVEKQLSSTVPNFEKNGTTDTTVAGLPAKAISYSGSADNTLIMFKQLFVVSQDIMYFICLADAESGFETTLRDAQAVVDAFVLK